MTDKAYDVAIHTFLREPEALTEAQIDLMKGVDTWLGERAGRKRECALTKAADVRHRAAMGQPPAKIDPQEEMAEMVIDTIGVNGAPMRARIGTLEASNAALESRIYALESRLLEVEAQHAMRSAVPDAEG